MAAMLTFYPRRALLEATAGGHTFYLPVYQDSARVAAWEKAQQLRPGKVTLWDHSFELPGGQPDSHAGSGLYVGPRTSGTLSIVG